MLILTNCLTEVLDEGCLKVANSLIKRLKKADNSTYVVTYDREHELSDKHISVNKLLLSGELKNTIKKNNSPVLYIPFPSKTLYTALRTFILSLFCKKDLSVAMVMKYHFNALAKFLLKLSKAKLIVFSKDAQDFYTKFVKKSRVTYLKTGVDTDRFVPVTEEEKRKLKAKYGFDENRPVILHVGHLKYGRNVDKLIKINEKYQVVLVCSTLTENEQNRELREKLLSCPNIKIIDEYLPNIQEIYQLSDIYFFPTLESGNCIDVPLSCMEAASCDKAIITTDYGEMKEFVGKDGFYFIKDMEKESIDNLINKALKQKCSTREAVLDYNWQNAVDYLLNIK